MIDRIRAYLEHAFADAPKTRRVEDLREELFSNLVEKYNDRLRQGMSEEDAKTALEAIGLTLGERKEEKSEDVAKGMIISQDILAPTDTPQGTAVGYTVSTGKGKQYVAVINDDFPLKDLFGPSSGDMQIQVRIVAIQEVDGRQVVNELMPPRTMGGNITIPVHYRIPGEPGVLTGELQIQDLSNDKVLKSYPLEFLEVDE